MLRPYVSRQAFHHCRRFISPDFRHEVPVELEKSYCTEQPIFLLREAFCLSHKSADSLPQYSVEVLHIYCVNVILIRIPVNDPPLLPDELSPRISYLHQLAVVDHVGGKETTEGVGVIVIPIRECLGLQLRIEAQSSPEIIYH